MSSSGESQERVRKRETIGKKVQLATKGLLTFSIRKGSVVSGLESPTGSQSPGSNEGSSSGRGSAALNSPSKVQPLTLLFLYSRTNDVNGLREVLKGDPLLVKQKDYDKRSALHIAAIHGCLKAAEVLLDHGADVNSLDRWKNSVRLCLTCFRRRRDNAIRASPSILLVVTYFGPPSICGFVTQG